MARTFGIEIEFVYDRADQHGGAERLLGECAIRGIDVLDRRNTHMGSDPIKWTLKRDGSVTYGGEMVSPVLDFDNPDHRAQVDKVMEALQAAGCNSDEKAGIHVHVGCPDFTPKQLAAVLRFCYKFEDALFRIATSGWETLRPMPHSHWCKPVPAALASEAMKIRTADQVARIWYNRVDRYMMVNIHSWYRRQTLEFRLFNSTLNPKRAQAYIALAVTIIDDARRGYSRSTAKHFTAGYMLEKQQATGNKKAADALILKLQQILRYQSGMSEQDWKLIRWCWKDSAPQTHTIVHTGRQFGRRAI